MSWVHSDIDFDMAKLDDFFPGRLLEPVGVLRKKETWLKFHGMSLRPV